MHKGSQTFDAYNYHIGPIGFFSVLHLLQYKKTTREFKARVKDWPWAYNKAKDYLQGQGLDLQGKGQGLQAIKPGQGQGLTSLLECHHFCAAIFEMFLLVSYCGTHSHI